MKLYCAIDIMYTMGRGGSYASRMLYKGLLAQILVIVHSNISRRM